MASRGVNKVIILGNLGQDPEVRYMSNGNAVANITVATSETWKDQQGQQQERTEWHRIVFFGKIAEIAGEYLRKGSQVYVEGRLQTRKWQDQSGQDRYTTEVVVDQGGSMQMLGSRNQNAQQNQGGYGNQQPAYTPPPQQPAYNSPQPAAQPQQQPAPQQYAQPAPAQQGQQQYAKPQPAPQQPNHSPDLDDGWDDDIPF